MGGVQERWGRFVAASVRAFEVTVRRTVFTPSTRRRRCSRHRRDAGDDEDDDFWAEDEDEDPAAAKALEEAKAKAMAKLAKKEANQRSLCNLEIKPWEADQDLKALYSKIKATVVKDG